MARFRTIRGNKSASTPGSVCFVDTETLPEPLPGGGELHKLRLGIARYCRIESGQRTRRQETLFTRRDQFWNWLRKRVSWQRPTWVFMHNAGFDLRVLGIKEVIQSGRVTFRHEYNRKGKLTIAKGFLCDEDPPMIMNCFLDGGGRVIFCDSMNWFRSALDVVGESVGIPKQDRPDWGESNSTWAAYCRRDVDILEAAITGLMDWTTKHDLGMFRQTAPAQARAAWRHRFKTDDIACHDVEPVRRLEREGYFSGRVQVFQAGKLDETIHEVDACGAYVSVLHDEKFPVALLRSSSGKSPGRCPVWDNPSECVASVKLDTEELYPVRLENGAVWWANGVFDTTLSGPELSYAISCGHVKKVHRWALYRTEKAFHEFAAWTWETRIEHEKAGETLYAELSKLIGNSFFGKWGQRGIKWKPTTYRADLPPFERRWVSTEEEPRGVVFRSIGDLNQILVQEDENPNAFPAIAGWTTAFLRQRLRTWRADAGTENVPYVCCDAIYVNDDGLKRLWARGWIGSRKLGLLEERKTAPAAEFFGPNNLLFGDDRKAAGIKKDNPPDENGYVKSTLFTGFQEGTALPYLHGVKAETKNIKLPKEGIRGDIQSDGFVKPLRLKYV